MTQDARPRAAPRDARLSVRVPQTLKDSIAERVTQLRQRGLATSESELVELLVSEGLHELDGDLEARLLRWRGERA